LTWRLRVMPEPLETPPWLNEPGVAFVLRLKTGEWLGIRADGRVHGEAHDIVINRIPAMLNQAAAGVLLEYVYASKAGA
jgi:hypothetical protein